MKIHFVLLLGISLFACHQKEITKTDNNKPISNASTGDETKAVVIDASMDVSSTGAMYTIDSMKITGNILSIMVNYSGGCKTHEWELISNGLFEKSLPPKVAVCLKHKNNGDACRELVTKELKFNIAKLKSPNSKTVIVKIGDKQIRYTQE
ncbi:MAG: hypothetical protein WCP52_10840 [Bacteroidota bacterium]